MNQLLCECCLILLPINYYFHLKIKLRSTLIYLSQFTKLDLNSQFQSMLRNELFFYQTFTDTPSEDLNMKSLQKISNSCIFVPE